MTTERLLLLLRQQESEHLEFKEAKFALPTSLFETICAMLNGDGGDIILGVNDFGNVTGIDVDQVDKMMNDLANLSNDPAKINPTFLLFPRKCQVDEKWLIHLYVPASSQVHKLSKVIYKRSGDGDFKIVEAQQIADIFNRKRLHYTENTVYPALRFDDFNSALFPKIRNLIRSNNADHPWLALDDRQLLETAGLWRRDFLTGREGYTLAAALLMGRDDVITQILPHYKIDALLRIEDTNRYDDRLYIQTNLIEAYEQLMGFVEKHLPDKFFLQGDQRISLRSAIFREVAANIIVHREYTNARPCTFVIGKSTVETQNANNPHGEGMINPYRFAPFPKNPVIAKFFIQLGRVDELGSGVLNVTRFIKQYAGKRKPEFLEGFIFRTKIPIPEIRIDAADRGKRISEHAQNTTSNALSTKHLNIEKTASLQGITCCGQTVPPQIIEIVKQLIEESISGEEVDELASSSKIELIQLVALVVQQEGQKAHQLAEKLQKSRSMTERYIKRARDLNILRFLGASKTGGYYISDHFENRLGQKIRMRPTSENDV